MKEQKKSSWGAVLVSFLKEFLLNSFEAPGHLYYDENLTNEGKRKKNYIWRVLLLVTAVGVALLPVIAWNMFVPDVLWAKIVTVVVCEGYVVFIVSMEIIQIKDELKEDMLKIGGYKITPKGSISLFKEIDFKIAQTEYSYIILISKKPLKWLYKKFYVTIYGRHGKVKKIELVRADKKYSTKYETMNGTVLEKLQEENNRFLRKCLGTPSKKSMTGVEYYYEWGQIQSFYDDRSCQTGIVIMFYNKEYCISCFRMQKDYIGTEKCGSDTPKNTGETLYLGSTSSESFKRERWVKLRCLYNSRGRCFIPCYYTFFSMFSPLLLGT